MNNHQMNLTYRKKLIVSKVESLTQVEHGEIFKIMERNSSPYSQNKNGYFFNIAMLGESVVSEIEQFIEYCHNNKKDIDDYNKRLDECKLKGTISSTRGENEDRGGGGEDEEDEEDGDVIVVLDEEVEEEMDEEDEVKKVVAAASVTTFVDRKKTMTKFVIAKKRFAKKTVNEQRVDYDVGEIL